MNNNRFRVKTFIHLKTTIMQNLIITGLFSGIDPDALLAYVILLNAIIVISSVKLSKKIKRQ